MKLKTSFFFLFITKLDINYQKLELYFLKLPIYNVNRGEHNESFFFGLR